MPKDEKKNTQEVDTPETSNNEEVQEDTTFKQEDVDKIITERLAREREKWQKEVKELEKEKAKELEQEKKEIEKLANLSAKEREEELQKKYEEDLNKKELVLAERENRLEIIDKFSEAKVPLHLVDLVIDPDRDKTLEKAEQFIETYQKSVEVSVADKLKGSPPKDVKPNSKPTPKRVVTSF
jgi:hypothetical protein